jgi:hypothetical protein
MRIINRMADRLLAAVVPEIKAGACCPPDTTLHFCYCRGFQVAVGRYCSYNCACQLSCGACNVYYSDPHCP